MYEITSSGGEEAEELKNWQLVGIELGVFAREIMEINIGTQCFVKPGETTGPCTHSINVSIPLSDYLSEIVDL